MPAGAQIEVAGFFPAEFLCPFRERRHHARIAASAFSHAIRRVRALLRWQTRPQCLGLGVARVPLKDLIGVHRFPIIRMIFRRVLADAGSTAQVGSGKRS